MGLFDFITGKHLDEQTEEEQAEQYLESEGDGVSPLVRGYVIEEVTDHIEDTTYTPVTTDQVNGWYGDGLITGFEGFLLLTDRTI